MRLVFTFPFCSHLVNSISQGPLRLGENGNDILVITSQHTNSLKGNVTAPYLEKIGRTEFFRPYPHSNDIIKNKSRFIGEVINKVAAFSPDIIIGFGDFCAQLPVMLSKRFNLPLLMNLEYLRSEKLSLPIKGRSYLKKYLPKLYKYTANIHLRSIVRHCDAIMFTYHGDKNLIRLLESWGTHAFYVPWCTEVGENDQTLTRDRHVGIHIGSLEPFKNAEELIKTIPIIFERTRTKRFIVVGPGTFAPRIKKLAVRYGSRLQYIESLPRTDALQLLRTSGYAYTPAKDSGAGFIGDCWGTGTPLIATHAIGGLINPGVDTLRAQGYHELPKVINELMNSIELYDSLQKSGFRRYENEFSANAVANSYKSIIQNVL